MSPVIRGEDGRPWAFEDFPIEAFPVEMTAFFHDEIIWQCTVRPYEVVEIPAAEPEKRGHIAMHVRFGSGEEFVYGPISMEKAHAYIEQRNEERP